MQSKIPMIYNHRHTTYLKLPTRDVGASERLEADPSDSVLVMRLLLFLLRFLLQ